MNNKLNNKDQFLSHNHDADVGSDAGASGSADHLRRKFLSVPIKLGQLLLSYRVLQILTGTFSLFGLSKKSWAQILPFANWKKAGPPPLVWVYHTSLSSTAWGTATVMTIESNGTILIAGGTGGTVATSADNGVSWTYQAGLSGTTWGAADVNVIKWNGSFFIAGGTSGKIATSPDGITWTYRSSLAGNATWASNHVTGIAWSGSQFAAVAAGGTKAGRSSDGITWTATNYAGTTMSAGVRHLLWDGAQYVGCKNTPGGSSLAIVTSPDSTTWTTRSLSGWGLTSANDIVWTGALMVTGGDSGRVGTSPDGTTWTDQASLRTGTWGSTKINAVAWNGTTYVIAGLNGKTATSTNAVTWSYETSLSSTGWGSTDAVQVVYGTTDFFIAGGVNGKIATCTA